MRAGRTHVRAHRLGHAGIRERGAVEEPAVLVVEQLQGRREEGCQSATHANQRRPSWQGRTQSLFCFQPLASVEAVLATDDLKIMRAWPPPQNLDESPAQAVDRSTAVQSTAASERRPESQNALDRHWCEGFSTET